VGCTHEPVLPNPTTPDGCCPAGATEAQDADCLPPCGPDTPENCTNPCEGLRCPDGQYCQNGSCVPWPEDQEGQDPNNPADPGLGTGATVGGCDCRTAAGGVPSPAALGALLLLGLLLRRRSR
jgi:MYXO-CTERM domain-containing protein